MTALFSSTSKKPVDAAAAVTTTTSATATSTIAELTRELGLMYAPISPFGKGQSIDTEDVDDVTMAADKKAILGGKGANLAEMSALGLSVPPGFTITTECCDRYCKNGDTDEDGWGQALPSQLWNQIVASIEAVEQELGSEFGSPSNPLLLSVRSGAAISMPGMVRLLRHEKFVLCGLFVYRGWYFLQSKHHHHT